MATIAELEAAGFIEKTRHGSKRICNLYAITWHPIDECKTKGGMSKLDVGPTRTPSNKWKRSVSIIKPLKQNPYTSIECKEHDLTPVMNV